MRAVAALSGVAAVASAAALVPRIVIPNTNGFPNPSSPQLLATETLADGLQPNGPPPPKLGSSSLTAFQLIAFNEYFESAYFGSLLYNITNGVDGYNHLDAGKKEELIEIFNTVLAQEELHALNAQGVLQHFNTFAPPPCEYKFGVSNIKDAVKLASTFTGVVLGTLQDVQNTLASNGDVGPIRIVASVIGQEGEQEGFYNILLARKPSAQPYLTAGLESFAFSALVNNFIVSCPFHLDQIALPVFAPLNVLSGNGEVSPMDQTLQFSVDLKDHEWVVQKYGGSQAGKGLFITYITGQQLPLSFPITNANWKGNTVIFEAFAPIKTDLMFGLSLAALTTTDHFASIADIPASTIAAPGLITVVDTVYADPDEL